MARAILEMNQSGSAATLARRFARDTLQSWQLPEAGIEVELVTTELVTNAVLHGAPPISLQLAHEGDVVRIEVADGSPSPPVPVESAPDSMTGRGLALVGSIAVQWGVSTAGAGRVGKLVWAEVSTSDAAERAELAEQAGLAALPEPTSAVFEFVIDEPDGAAPAEPQHTVALADVPTDMLVAAKAHVENVVRELTLASYDTDPSPRVGAAGLDGPLEGPPLAQLLHDVVTGFAPARHAIKAQALAAAARGEARMNLTLTVGLSMADAGERYLAALDEVDEYARAARLLTVETPPEHRAFRRWYVQSLVDQLRALAVGETPPTPPTFERFLLGEVATIAVAQRISDRAARLQRVTAALATALTASDVAHVAVAECLLALGASGGALVLFDDDGEPYVAGEIGLEWPSPEARAIDEALERARPVWLESHAEHSRTTLELPLEKPSEVAASCAVPLAVVGQLIGALGLTFASAQLFDADERAFVDALAAEVAQTLTRTKLHAAQARLAQRLSQLQRVATDLARCSLVGEVSEAVVRHAMAAGDAVIGTLCLPTEDRASLIVAEMAGAESAQRERWKAFENDGTLPASEAFLTGEPVVLRSVEERDRRFPRLAGTPPYDAHALACLPLRVEDDVRGVLGLTFARGRRIDDEEVGFLVALADVCAQALARAQALEHAAAASERFAFLAEVSRRLAASLDYEQTLQTVADLAVPRLADWCGIDVLDGQELLSVAVAHADPERVEFARELRALYPQSRDSTTGVRGVVSSGRTLFLPSMTDDMLRAEAVDERHLEMMRSLGMAGVVIVPLRAGARVVGALSLIRTDARHAFTEEDVQLAEDVGRRAGTAVENARLFREVHAARQSEDGANFARLDLALEAASIGSFDWDLVTNVLTWDDRMRAIFDARSTAPTTTGEALRDAIVAADRPMFDRALERATRHLDDFSVESRIRRADGSLRWIDCRGRVLTDAGGASTRVIGIAFDSTEVREARDRIARTLEHMGDAFFSLDTEWRITYINAAGERLLRRDRRLLLGRTFWAQFPAAVGGRFDRECRRALAAGHPVAFEHHMPESGQHLEVRALPIPGGLGVYVTDVSRSREYERERAELRAASQHARSEAELARSRLAFIAEASADITTTLDPVEVCRRLSRHAVGRLADWVSIYIVEGEQCHRVAAAHRDPRWAPAVARLVDNFPVDIASNAMVAQAARTGRPVLEQHMDAQHVYDTYPDPAGRALVEGMGVSSALVTPMTARNEVVGVIAFVRADPENLFEPDEVQLALTLAGRAALAVENAQLYARQTTVAQTLQQAVLPEALPVVPGVSLAARYEPALGGAGVGGDFYDVFPLPSGCIALAVGDAAGHGLQSGALMGQLRNALRAYAVQQRGPAATLQALSALIAGLEPDAFGTAFYAELDPASGELSWASAGHPPPLLVVPGEPARYLDGRASAPLGLVDMPDGDGGALRLPSGGGVFMYTDGLVERRRVDITEGLESLRMLIDKQPAGAGIVDAAVRGMRGESGFADDVCVLFAVRS